MTAVDDRGDVVERVGEAAPRRHVRLAEARQVGRHDVETIGQMRDQIPEHVARAREAVKQQQRRCVGGAGLAIRDLQAVHIGGAVFDRSHWDSPEFVTLSIGKERLLSGTADRRCGAHGLADDVHDHAGRRDDRRMIDRV